MEAYFINQFVEQCGVHQYGRFLFDIIKKSKKFDFKYNIWKNEEDFYNAMVYSKPPIIIYNHHPLVNSYTYKAPFVFDWKPKQFMIYHDGPVIEEGWDGIIFSDPTKVDSGKWHYIGRPIPEWTPPPGVGLNKKFTVGLHGFCGGWSMEMIDAVKGQMDCAHIRLHLPPSPYVDPRGEEARHVANVCQEMVRGTNISVEINHNFISDPSQLLLWLHTNNVNCYVRPMAEWQGVSSALDLAMAAKRPIAINRCSAFRHFMGLTPSICLEDSNIHQIWAEGMKALEPLREKWSHRNVRKEFENALS